jgi:hypothetical protein
MNINDNKGMAGIGLNTYVSKECAYTIEITKN